MTQSRSLLACHQAVLGAGIIYPEHTDLQPYGVADATLYRAALPL